MLEKIIRKYVEKNNPQACNIDFEPLDELRRLTESLPSWSQRWAGNGDRIVSVDVARGECVAYGLHKEKDIGVALCEQAADTFFECHSHAGNEYVLCVEGEIHLDFMDDEKVILYPGMAFCIPAGKNHSAFFPVWTRSLAATIPADENFPNGGRWSERIEDQPAG